MTRHSLSLKSVFLIAALMALVLLIRGGQEFAAAQGQLEEGLFAATDSRGSVAVDGQGHVSAYRFVTVRLEELGGMTPLAADFPDRLTLNLFPETSYDAELENLEYSAATGAWIWHGSIPGVVMSSVTLSVQNGVVVGVIRSGTGYYEIQYVGDNTHVIYEIDLRALPGEALPRETRPVSAAELLLAEEELAEGSDDGSLLDLLVVYTPAARAAAGGTSAIENLINIGVTETNQSYANSNVSPRIRLVHVEEVAYTEASLFTDLNRLVSPSDGFMDSVHTLRDTHSADLVTLINEDGSGFCGVAAMILNPVSTALEDQAFNVTWRVCITPNYTFGHELGHLQGARHNWEADGTNNAPYPYNHGYGETVGAGFAWRSVMAYSSACNCGNRELRWSNPDLNHPVTGNPTGRPLSGPQPTHNALTLNETAFTVANFRVSTPIIRDEFQFLPALFRLD